MELCTSRALSSPPVHPRRFFTTASHKSFNPSLSLNKRAHFPGTLYRSQTVLRAFSDETSSGESKITGERSDGIATLEDAPFVDNNVTLDNVAPVNEAVYNETKQPESSEAEESSSDDSLQPLNEFLDNFNIKLDSEDSYMIFLYGGGALVAVWLLSAIVGAIDALPVFPKLMEVVGLGYSLWFTTRYLLFKRNRDELVSKIEELKKEVLGSSDK